MDPRRAADSHDPCHRRPRPALDGLRLYSLLPHHDACRCHEYIAGHAAGAAERDPSRFRVSRRAPWPIADRWHAADRARFGDPRWPRLFARTTARGDAIAMIVSRPHTASGRLALIPR